MDHFDGTATDDQCGPAIWEWQSQDTYYGMQKDDLLPAGLADPSSSVWDFEYQFCEIQDPCTSLCAQASNSNVNAGDDDWSNLFHQQTPIKYCADMAHHFSDIPADILTKDSEEANETLQAKRRRTLQFSPENVEMTRPMTTEGGLSQNLQVMDSSGTSCLLNSDGTDEVREEWQVNCLQDVETACFPADEMNIHVAAMEKAVDIISDRPAMLKGVPNTCPPGKNIVTRKEPYVAYPFDKLSSSISGGVTIRDINEMIKAKPPYKNDEELKSFQSSAIFGKPMVHKRRIHALPPHKIKHGNDEDPNSFQVSAISGKPVLLKGTIHTKGNGTITIIRS